MGFPKVLKNLSSFHVYGVVGDRLIRPIFSCQCKTPSSLCMTTTLKTTNVLSIVGHARRGMKVDCCCMPKFNLGIFVKIVQKIC
jgi:hypothetical protein